MLRSNGQPKAASDIEIDSALAALATIRQERVCAGDEAWHFGNRSQADRDRTIDQEHSQGARRRAVDREAVDGARDGPHAPPRDERA